MTSFFDALLYLSYAVTFIGWAVGLIIVIWWRLGADPMSDPISWLLGRIGAMFKTLREAVNKAGMHGGDGQPGPGLGI